MTMVELKNGINTSIMHGIKPYGFVLSLDAYHAICKMGFSDPQAPRPIIIMGLTSIVSPLVPDGFWFVCGKEAFERHQIERDIALQFDEISEAYTYILGSSK